MKVLLLKPGYNAEIVDISDGLESMQKIVGGWIESLYFSEKDEVALICNEEGKINGLIPNRAIEDDNGNLVDIVFGTCFICGIGEENFISLSDDLCRKYFEKYKYPQEFNVLEDVIYVTSYNSEYVLSHRGVKMYRYNK